MINDHGGRYQYKGFTIWCPSDRWIADPNWDNEKAVQNFNQQSPSFGTIRETKQWIDKNGGSIDEKRYI